MRMMQSEQYYQLKELQNLLNNFEKVYPILKKSIEKFEIREVENQCYLSWIAGVNFYKPDIFLLEKFILEILFKNIFKTLEMNNVSVKAILFIYFSFGAIAALNYSNNKKDYYKDYLYVISKGAVIIDKVKFDTYKNGIKYWRLQTLAAYFNYNSKNIISRNNIIKESNSNKFEGNIIIN